uniref:G-protein coupled receptors family 1 profile domain-containing protein n=1 Tax=Ditylenchus dipsaci TaxID=166011 RepID=A0A915ERJ6_9BILA
MEVPSAIFLPCLRPSAFDEINSTSSSLDDHKDLVEEDYSASNNHTFARKSSFITSTTPIPQELIEELSESTETLFTVRAQENDCMKLKLAFWSNGMIFKVVPCLLLTVSIVALLNIIADVSHKRRNLAQVMKKKVPKDHTTPMLAAVLSIFLIAELPQGVMLVLTGIFSSETFHKKIYLPLGDFMDILSLLNSAIGFLIYVGMSRKFRSVFFQLFFSCLRWTFIVNKTSSGCFQFHVERGPQNGSGETGDRPSAFFNCNPKDKGDRLCQYRNLQHRSSRFTTNDNTRTEQLSHYPSTTSTLNAYGGLCAAATASAAAQLGSHLMFFDSSQTVSVKLPVQSSHLLSPQNAYLMPPSTKPPILKDSHSSVDTTETPRNELTVDSKPAKRISFNLSYNDSHSNTSKSGLLPLYFAVKKQNQQVAQQSTSHILPDPNSTMTYETENVKSEKKTVTVKTVKKNSVIGVMRRLFWPDEEIEAEIYKQNVDCVGSTSPQRKRTILQTELNLVGTFY